MGVEVRGRLTEWRSFRWGEKEGEEEEDGDGDAMEGGEEEDGGCSRGAGEAFVKVRCCWGAEGCGLRGFGRRHSDRETMPAAARRRSSAVDVPLGSRPPWKTGSLVSCHSSQT